MQVKYQPRGLVVLAFPCNQFANQEPGSPAEIKAFAAAKGATFPLFAKIDVNGADAHPLFKWLQDALPGTLSNSLKWNFTKFLLIRGVPYKRYAPTDNPLSFEEDIVKALELADAAPGATDHGGKGDL